MDGQLVSLEMSSLISGVSALGAFKRFLTAMNQHMSFQIARTTCCVVALIATEGLHFNVQRLLRLFCIIIRLCFHVFIAKESFKLCYVSRDRKLFKRRNRLMPVLFPFMTSHIRISVKSRWAKGALVFLFISMNFHMILQTSTAPDIFATYFTFKHLGRIAQAVVCLFMALLFPICPKSLWANADTTGIVIKSRATSDTIWRQPGALVWTKLIPAGNLASSH